MERMQYEVKINAINKQQLNMLLKDLLYDQISLYEKLNFNKNEAYDFLEINSNYEILESYILDDSCIIKLISNHESLILWEMICKIYHVSAKILYFDCYIKYAGMLHITFLESENDIEIKNHIEYNNENLSDCINLYKFLLDNKILSNQELYEIINEKIIEQKLTFIEMNAIKVLNEKISNFDFEFNKAIVYNIDMEEDLPIPVPIEEGVDE